MLRESSNVLIQLAAANGQLANQAPAQLERPVPGLPTLLDWRPWNEALAMASLVADHQLVEAALAIDAEIWPIHLKIKAGAVAEGDWFALRDRIEDRRRDFVNVARNHLASAGPKLTRLTGRPNPEDPIWHLRHLFPPPPRGSRTSGGIMPWSPPRGRRVLTVNGGRFSGVFMTVDLHGRALVRWGTVGVRHRCQPAAFSSAPATIVRF